MALGFVKIAEIGGKRQCTIDANGVRKYTRVWLVTTDDRQVDSNNVQAAPGIPNMFDFYQTSSSVDTQALVNEKSAREDGENPYKWEVQVDYSSDCPNPVYGVEDPTLDDPKFVWEVEELKEVVEMSLDTPPLKIANSAGQPFDPPPEKDVMERKLIVTRNEATWDPSTEDVYAYSTNTESFAGYAPGEGRMQPIKAEEAFGAGKVYWKKTYEFRFRKAPRTWTIRPLDHGPCILGPDGNPMTYHGMDGAATGSILLNGLGQRLDPAISNPFYFDFKVYNAVDWTPLGINPP